MKASIRAGHRISPSRSGTARGSTGGAVFREVRCPVDANIGSSAGAYGRAPAERVTGYSHEFNRASHNAGGIINKFGGTDTLASRVFEFMPYTLLFNATGQPAMSVPLYWNDAGLPIGMQFVGRYGDEATLFRLAGQIEEAKPWFDRVLPVCTRVAV